MALIEEARSRLEAEVVSYLRRAQAPFHPVLPSLQEGLQSLGAAAAGSMKGTVAAVPAAAATSNGKKKQQDTHNGAKAFTAAATTTTASAPPQQRQQGTSKQARARLHDAVKKFQRAAYVVSRASRDDTNLSGVDGHPSGSRRGTRNWDDEAGSLSSRQQSFMTRTSAMSHTASPPLPVLASTVPRSSSPQHGGKKGSSGFDTKTSVAAVTAAASIRAADMQGAAAANSPPSAKKTELPDTSSFASFPPSTQQQPHRPHSPLVASATSPASSQRRHTDRRDRATSFAATVVSVDRDGSASVRSRRGSNRHPLGHDSSSSAAAAQSALRRLRSWLVFAQDCLRHAAALAEAGLVQDAQLCFLQPITQDMTTLYEPMVAQCVERQGRSANILDGAEGAENANVGAGRASGGAAPSSAGAARRASRMREAKSVKEPRKQMALSSSLLEGGSATACGALATSQGTAVDSAGTATSALSDGGGVRVTDTLNVFAPDVPLPLVLQVYKCVLRYRNLVAYVKFRELLQSDPYGDGAAMATSVEACACIENLVQQQRQVLQRTPLFSAAAVVAQEEAKIREDVAHAVAAKPVSAMLLPGGCRLTDLLAEPVTEGSGETDAASLLPVRPTADPPVSMTTSSSLTRLYAVDDVAAPVLLTSRHWMATMCAQLFAYVHQTPRRMASVSDEVRRDVVRRSLDCLRASAAMSELPVAKSVGPTSTAAAANALPMRMCLPLASVAYLPWRLQEYSLMQQGFLHLEADTAAVHAAETALHQVLQLMELEHLDAVPPSPRSVQTMDAAIQQCAGWLLVATWRAAVAQGAGGAHAAAGGSAAVVAAASSGEGPSMTSAESGAGDGSGSQLLSSAAPSTTNHHGTTTTTARHALTAIIAAIQQAVSYLLSVQSPSFISGMHGNGGIGPAAAAAAPSSTASSSSTPSQQQQQQRPRLDSNARANGAVTKNPFKSLSGTRLLVALWATVAQVQQQCVLLRGRADVAATLAAAALDVECCGDDTKSAGEGERNHNSTDKNVTAGRFSSPAGAAAGGGVSPRSQSGTSNAARKSTLKRNGTAAAASPSSTSPDRGEASQHAEIDASIVPVELKHAHPAVADLAHDFPRLALDTLLKLVNVVEAAGAVPQAPILSSAEYTGYHTHHHANPATDAAVDGGVARSTGLKAAAARSGRDTSLERRAAPKGGRSGNEAAVVADAGGGVQGAAASASVVKTSPKVQALQAAYRGCVEALEVLLHGAAMTTRASAKQLNDEANMNDDGVADVKARSLSALTRAVVWSDCAEVLGHCDEAASEGVLRATTTISTSTSPTRRCTDPADTKDNTTPRSAPSPPIPPAAASAATSALSSACFLYNPADTRCLLRWLSFDILFPIKGDTSAITEDDLNNAGNGSAGGVHFTPQSLAEAAVVRLVTALRTVTFASPRLAVVVRVTVAMEAWGRAVLAPTAAGDRGVGDRTAKEATNGSAGTALKLPLEGALRCVQLLRAFLLGSMLQRSLPRHRESPRCGSPLAAVLRTFEETARLLDGPHLPLSTSFRGSPSPQLSPPPADHSHGTASEPALPPPGPAQTETEKYQQLAQSAQTSVVLFAWHVRAARAPTTAGGNTSSSSSDDCEVHADVYGMMPLREVTEPFVHVGDGEHVWSANGSANASPASMEQYKTCAVLLDKLATALCPAFSDADTIHTSTQNTAMPIVPSSPSWAVLLLPPLAEDAATLLLRCGVSLRLQWQERRRRRQLLPGTQDHTYACAQDEEADETATAAGFTASASPARSSSREEQEAQEEAHYATIVSCVLDVLCRSNGGGSGLPVRLEEAQVAALTCSTSRGFLQLVPAAHASTSAKGRRTSPLSGPSPASTQLSPTALTRLIAHGATVRCVLELVRGQLQRHVESLLRHTAVVLPSASFYGATAARAHRQQLPAASEAQKTAQRQTLVTARDALTELTHTWVTVRWQLARLQAHQADQSAHRTDLETLQRRQEQQNVYGRTTIKELRILRTLEQDMPALPVTATAEEVRLKRWVKDKQRATGTSGSGSNCSNNSSTATASLLLLEALVAVALVPLNATDVAAAQKLVEEAMTALTEAERECGKPAPTASHRPNSGGRSRPAATHLQQQQSVLPSSNGRFHTSLLYTPVLLWCYLADACSRCGGTTAQLTQIRAALDKQLLTATSPTSTAAAASTSPTATTATFVQTLLLHPRWVVLHSCSVITRLAFCRALCAVAARSGKTSAATVEGAESGALGSLQSAYRLLLALQIQRLPDTLPSTEAPSAVTTTATSGAAAGGNPGGAPVASRAPDRPKKDTKDVAPPGGNVRGGISSFSELSGSSTTSTLALETAQHLLTCISDYLASSGVSHNTSQGGTAATPLLLPLLVELCAVLLHLPSRAPQWGDAEVQLFALRVLTLFQQQQQAVLHTAPSALVPDGLAGAASDASAAAATVTMDVLLHLLWSTFTHVWNSVHCNPNARQRRHKKDSAHVSDSARRVYEQHHRCAASVAAGAAVTAATTTIGAGKAVPATASASEKAHEEGGSEFTSDMIGASSEVWNVLVNAYLPRGDSADVQGVAAGSAGATAATAKDTSHTPADTDASAAQTKDSAVNSANPMAHSGASRISSGDGAAGAGIASATLLLHAHMPPEYMELLEDLLFHMPALWSLDTATAAGVPDATAALSQQVSEGSSGADGAEDGNKKTCDKDETLAVAMHSQHDFLCYAARQAGRVLRQTRKLGGGAAATTTSAESTGVHALLGVPPIYAETVACLRTYRTTLQSLAGSSATSMGGATALSGGGNNAGLRGGSGNRSIGTGSPTLSFSVAGKGLMECLAKYTEDPAYVKLMAHVVREMLAVCDDTTPAAYLGFLTRCAGGVQASGVGSNTHAAAAAAVNAAGAVNNSSSANVSNVVAASGGPRKRAGAGGADAGPDGNGLNGKGGVSLATFAIVSDVLCVLSSVREQARRTQQNMKAYFARVERETETWLTKSGFNLAAQSSKHPYQPPHDGAHATDEDDARVLTSNTDAVPGSGRGRAAGAAGPGGKKAGGGNKKASLKSSRKSKGGNADDADDPFLDDDYADSQQGFLKAAAGPSVPYTRVTHTFSFVEQQKLQQLTCALARRRRRRAARLLRERYVQFNLPFLAQLHLMEAGLLCMGAAAQKTLAQEESTVHELVARLEQKRLMLRAAGALASVSARSPSISATTRGVGKEKSKSTAAPTSSSAMAKNEVDASAVAAYTTLELLWHCVRACNLFQNVWLPTRASGAVQLALTHLRGMSVSVFYQHQNVTVVTRLLKQLVAAPLFCMAAVQDGYFDARRDVYTCVLQPTVMTVGASVAWRHRGDAVRTVPSLFTLVSLEGQQGEETAQQRRRAQAAQERRYAELQMRQCAEDEEETRAEAQRDELHARVRLLQRVQETFPHLTPSNVAQKTMLAAAELLSCRHSPGAAKSRHGGGTRTSTTPKDDPAMRGAARTSAALRGGAQTVPNHEAVYAAVALAAESMTYFPFPEAAQEASSGTREEKQRRRHEEEDEGTSTPAEDAAAYGPEMREATLVDHVTFFGHLLESVDPKTCVAAYRAAQQRTRGRFALALLPLLLQVEDAVGVAGQKSAAATAPPTTTAALPTTQAYEKALRSVSGGVWLLSVARSKRRKWCASPSVASTFSPFTTAAAAVAERNAPHPTVSIAVDIVGDGHGDEPGLSCKHVVAAYQQAAQALRSTGPLPLLGECLYEVGHLYRMLGRVGEAEKRWLDALDCFLSTPHVLEEWHTQRAVPPPPTFSSLSSGGSGGAAKRRREFEELVWMTATLTALAEYAYVADAARALDAQLLCAVLVRQYWRLPGLVAAGPSFIRPANRSPSSPAAASSPALLPAMEYSQVDVGTLCTSQPQPAPPFSPTPSLPDSLTDIVRALTNAARFLVEVHHAGEATVLSAFSDFIATVHVQHVTLATEARLVRGVAAAELGSFSAAMRHVHAACVGAGLPQTVAHQVGLGRLRGYRSIACAVVSLVETASLARIAGAAAAVAAPIAALSSSGGPSSAAPATTAAPSTVLPLTATAAFYFYRDDESPTTPHNVASVRAFAVACLPGVAWDAALGSSAAANLASFAQSVLASPVLESYYGVQRTWNVCLAVAHVLVRLATCDPTYLFRTPPSSLSPSTTAAEDYKAAPLVSGTRRGAAATGGGRAASDGLRRSSASAAASTTAPYPESIHVQHSANAPTEACHYAQVILQSLSVADVRFILTGQFSPALEAESSEDNGGHPHRSPSPHRSTAASAALNTAPRAQKESRGYSSTVGSMAAVVAAEAAAASSAEPTPCAEELLLLGAARQWAVLRTGEVLAARGQYAACVELLTAAVAEYNDAQAREVRNGGTEEERVSAGRLRAHASRRTNAGRSNTLDVATLRGHGLQGSGSGSGTAALPFTLTVAYWTRVWQLLCRCYGQLRQYAKLEDGASMQGLRLCAALGGTGEARRTFQLYRLYALLQMGRLRDAAEMIGGVQRDVACGNPRDKAGSTAATTCLANMGLCEDGSLMAALLWWQQEQKKRECASGRVLSQSAAPPHASPSMLLLAQQAVRQRWSDAVHERGILPWHLLATPSSASSSSHPPTYVLESLVAHTILPRCPASAFAKTRDVWRLHDAVNRYVAQLSLRSGLGVTGASINDPWKATPSSLSSDAPTRDTTKMHSSGNEDSTRTATAARTSPPPCPLLLTMAASSVDLPASVPLKEALAALTPQYAAATHPSRWIESRLLLVRWNAGALCAQLRQERCHQKNKAEEHSVLLPDYFEDRTTVSAPSLSVATPPSSAVPLLSSRDATLRCLPPPVRTVCAQLLDTLQRCVELPVQQHAWVRVLLLDLVAVLSAHLQDLRGCQRRRQMSGGSDLTASSAEKSLIPQLEATMAACTLLAGLVSDMEHRVRTGADSFRGYAKDPRFESLEAADGVAAMLQAQWPESLRAAVQHTHDTVGQLQTFTGANRRETESSVGNASSILANPHHTQMAALLLPQQHQGGTAGATASMGSGSTTAKLARSSSTASRDISPINTHGANCGAQQGRTTSAAGPRPSSGLSPAPPSSTSLLSVPTLALTYAALADEAAAVRALLPVDDAIDHDTALQLLITHLQSVSPPINCTYLCYRDATRQRMLDLLEAVFAQQRLQQQQQQQQGRGGGMRKAGGGGGGGGAALSRRIDGGATAGPPSIGVAGTGVHLALTDLDVWKALMPPVLLSAVPAELFSPAGPDTLGAPLYNSVAAAALCVSGAARAGGATARTDTEQHPATGKTTSTWQLFLAVSPLHDASLAEAPAIPASATVSSASSVAAPAAGATGGAMGGADAAAGQLLLPPPQVLVAVSAMASTVESTETGLHAPNSRLSTPSAAALIGAGASSNNGGSGPMASSRTRGGARQGGGVAGAALNNGGNPSANTSTGAAAAMMMSASAANASVGGAGCGGGGNSGHQRVSDAPNSFMADHPVARPSAAWPSFASPAAAAASLVPSTNWALLDHIQRAHDGYGTSLLSPHRSDGGLAGFSRPPALPARGGRAAAAAAAGINGALLSIKPDQGASTSTAAAASEASTSPSGKDTGSPPPATAALDHNAGHLCGPTTHPLRWRCVSLEFSEATVHTLRRHLRAVQRCLRRGAEEDLDGMPNAATAAMATTATGSDSASVCLPMRIGGTNTSSPSPAPSQDPATAATATATVVRGESSSERADAARSALAAAVAQAQHTLRTHASVSGAGAAAGSTPTATPVQGTAGSFSGVGNVVSNSSSGVGGIAMGLGNGSNAVGGPNVNSAGSSAGAAGTASTAAGPSSSRKSGNRVGANSTNRRNSSNHTDMLQLTTAGLSMSALGMAAADDLTEATRARQAAERERQCRLYREELTETKSNLLSEWLEAVVTAAAAAVGSAMDEARVESGVRQLQLRGAVSKDLIEFLSDWLGGNAAATTEAGEEKEAALDAGSSSSSSSTGTAAVRFYAPDLHEWMQRIARYVAAQQQQPSSHMAA